MNHQRTELINTTPVLILLLVSLLTGCAVNPVTGNRELSFMSPEAEMKLGAETAKQVEKEMGLLKNAPELTQYVKTLGQRLAQNSPRQDVQYNFEVVDMAEPNAFALPGGYIYISRGLLAISNSESELANVIGHEIGHVAARHSAQRDTRAKITGGLSMLGTIAAAALGGAEAANLANQVGQVAGAGYIASYGRNQERQSDEIGQSLTAKAGWDPLAMTDFFTTLQRETELRAGGPRRASFLDSHPLSSERAASARERASALQVLPGAAIAPTRSEYFATIEGIMVGPDPAEGVFKDTLFLHPDIGFAIEFPKDWKYQNGKAAVVAIAPDGKTGVMLEGAGPPGDPQGAAQQFVQKNQGLKLQNARSLKVSGMDAFNATAPAKNGQTVALTWVNHPKGMFRITGVVNNDTSQQNLRAIGTTTESFRRLSAAEARNIKEKRLKVVRARANESIAALSRRTGNTWSVEETAIANAVAESERFSAGAPVKIAIEVPYRPST